MAPEKTTWEIRHLPSSRNNQFVISFSLAKRPIPATTKKKTQNNKQNEQKTEQKIINRLENTSDRLIVGRWHRCEVGTTETRNSHNEPA